MGGFPPFGFADRLVRLASHDWFSLHAVIDEFRIDLNQARALMAALVDAGFYTCKLSNRFRLPRRNTRRSLAAFGKIQETR
jgi:hypothetical protein